MHHSQREWNVIWSILPNQKILSLAKKVETTK